MSDHEQPGHDFTEGLTSLQMLARLEEFAVYGLDGKCAEVDQLVQKLKTAIDHRNLKRFVCAGEDNE